MGSRTALEATIYADGVQVYQEAFDAADPDFGGQPGLESLVERHHEFTELWLAVGATVRLVIHDPAGDVPDLVINVATTKPRD
jgi:hypothetical protein